jgi:tetratricopeptide (TPR) repeat protein
VAVDRDKVLQAAQKLVEKKRYDKAVVEYQKLVVDDPKDVRTLLKIGDLYLKMEQHADAIATYERVGQHYSQQGFHLKAIAVYKQIREIVHKHVPHLEDRFGHIVPKLAETYSQLGLTSDALAAYDEVATRYQRAGRDRDAIDVFRKIVDLDPQNPLPYLRLAEAFVRVRDVDNAIQRFGAAAEILLKLGRRDDALKVVERLLQHRADAKFARTAAEIYLERGEPSDAMAALTKLQICFKENPKDLETLALLARAFDKLGQPAKSIEVQKEAARIAKDAGKNDHFAALVEALLTRAPDDEGVRQLAAMRAPPSIKAPAPEPEHAPASTIDVELDDDADLDVAAASAAPFALRQSLPPGAGEAAAPEPGVRARQILAQVDAYRRAKDYDQAVALLFESIEEIPASRELREKLCDVLIEVGDQAEAVRQMLAFARWLGTAGDVDGAARILDEVLLLEPGQLEALQMLRELGYAVPTDEAAVDYEAEQPAAPHGSPYDPNAPLPSYDLEEVGAVDALAQHRPRAFAPSQLDDPFAMDGGGTPLPSFPMDEEGGGFGPPPDPRESAEFRMPAPAVYNSAPPGPVSDAGVTRGSQRPAGEPAQLDEDALDEVEFDVSQGMFDEARALLEEQLLRLPNHPLLLERLREVEEHAAAATSGGSGTRAVPRNGASQAPAYAAPPSQGPYSSEDRAFDIAASLDALDALDAGPQEAPPDAGDPNQVSVESVFEQFKAGVAAQISESDAATHYDLGVAYKEMGLAPDAIAEFELASRDPGRYCVCQSMIGMIHRERGDLDAAITAFGKGLQAQVKTREQELFLTYEVGDCYEAGRGTDQALYYFQRVARAEPNYSDPRGGVAERIRRLEPAPKPMPMPTARAVGSDAMGDEFDAALDDLLGGDLP